MPLLARHDRTSTLPTPTEVWHRQDTQATKVGVRSEFRYGVFDRVVQLPEDIDRDELGGSYAGGVLTVRFPLPPGKVAEEPRVVPVTTS